MVSTTNLVLGGLAIVLGVAWVIWPMTMVRWQNRILYFWVADDPEVEGVSKTLARIGGLALAIAGVVVIAGVQF